MRTLAVIFVLIALHAPFAAWAFLAVIWAVTPRWRVVYVQRGDQ